MLRGLALGVLAGLGLVWIGIVVQAAREDARDRRWHREFWARVRPAEDLA